MQKFVLLLAAALVGCSSSSGEPKRASKLRDVTGEFRATIYTLSDHEYVRVFDLPDRVMPTRCWVYVNDATHSTHMHCDGEGTATSDLPQQGAELER